MSKNELYILLEHLHATKLKGMMKAGLSPVLMQCVYGDVELVLF